jgi:hypothetical protein
VYTKERSIVIVEGYNLAYISWWVLFGPTIGSGYTCHCLLSWSNKGEISLALHHINIPSTFSLSIESGHANRCSGILVKETNKKKKLNTTLCKLLSNWPHTLQCYITILQRYYLIFSFIILHWYMLDYDAPQYLNHIVTCNSRFQLSILNCPFHITFKENQYKLILTINIKSNGLWF